MTRQEFAALVRHLSVYFNHKEPQPEQLELWYAMVARHPGGADLDLAAAELKAQEQQFPKNLPRALLAHLPPLREQPPRPVPCEHCRGTGILHGRRLGSSGGYAAEADYAFRCGHCRQSPCLGLPLVTREELPGLGFAPCD
ncbi:MAG: hypothetical protein KKA55_08865 [Proteobacteria bacterium]|nr:hypothetical protein [Pseudomonadota bacterium]MBU1595627.1 hypothetical protein [Pseudomonadota bacterium]